MELSQLRYFVQVAKLESISRAADELSVSQPALSKAVAKLEAELGCELFDRVGRRVYLNDRGRFFLKGVEGALEELGDAAMSVGAATSEVDGLLKLGVFGPQSEPMECVSAFMQRYPRVHVTFDARQTTTTSRVVREFDMVFYPQSPTFGDLCGMPYASKRLMLCVPEGHPLASAGEADLAQFANDPFIFMNTTAGLYEQTFHMCVEAGFRPWVRAVTTSGAAQMKFIQDGLGVGIVDTTRLNAGRRGTALVGLRGNDLEQVQCLACRAPYLLSRAGRLFMDFALEYFGIERAAALACFEGN